MARSSAPSAERARGRTQRHGVVRVASPVVNGWLALERRATRAAFQPVSGKPASWQRARSSYTVRVFRSTCGVGTRAPRGWELRCRGGSPRIGSILCTFSTFTSLNASNLAREKERERSNGEQSRRGVGQVGTMAAVNSRDKNRLEKRSSRRV